MKKRIFGSIVVCCMLLFTTIARAEDGLTRISKHVYSYVGVNEASAANSFGANAGIILGEKGIIIVDTLVSAKEAKRFIQDIKKVTDKPIKYVINTHYHLDHSFGNAEFSKLGAHIIVQKSCADELRLKAADTLTQAANYGLTAEDMAGTQIAYPDIIFTDSLEVDLDGLKVELIAANPSHSKGSILVNIPEEKVVFAGDILFTDFHPYMGDANLDGWYQALDQLAAISAEKIIPGHGPISSQKDVNGMKTYLTLFDSKAKSFAASWSGTLEDLVKEMKKSLPVRQNGEWIIGANLQSRYLAK